MTTGGPARATKGRRPRIALAIPTVELGEYWQPVMEELAARCDELRLFTAMPWRGAEDRHFHPDGFMTVVGEKRRLTTSGDADSDYGGGVMVLSPRIATALLRFRPDVVVVSGFSLWTMIALALRPLAGWRVVLLWEGSAPRVDFRDDPRRTRQRQVLARVADDVLTNSPGGRDYLLDHLGLPPESVTQAPYMVPDAVRLAGTAAPVDDEPGSERVTVLSVGRWEERKGVLALLRAVSGLPPEDRARVRVRLIGAGPQAEEIESFIAEAGLGDTVELVGWVPYADLGAHLAAADLLAFMTYEDTWGMVALEAMAVGTAVLCSRWAGAHALVDPALVVDPHDRDRTTATLRDLVRDPARVADLGAAAATAMSGHQPRHAAARLMHAAYRATEARRRRRA